MTEEQEIILKINELNFLLTGEAKEKYSPVLQEILNMLKEKDAEIEKKEKYLETQEENYKELIAGVSFIAQELGLEKDGTIDEIYAEIKKKDRTIAKMASYIGGVAFDNIIKKLKDDDIAYYGIDGAIEQYFKRKIRE